MLNMIILLILFTQYYAYIPHLYKEWLEAGCQAQEILLSESASYAWL